MAISKRSRKLLWGRSGNRCAICKCLLIKARTSCNDESVIGDESHIMSATPGGPRHSPNISKDRVDDYTNLILLCKVHHKLVDDQVATYPVSRLKKIKEKHEKWVSDQLEAARSRTKREGVRQVPQNVPEFLRRVNTGQELLDIVTHAHAFSPVYDELRDETENDLIANFLEDVQGYGELGLESVSDIMRASHYLGDLIGELERAGFWVFGFREYQIYVGRDGSETDWPVAHVHVLRDSNPDIINLEE